MGLLHTTLDALKYPKAAELRLQDADSVRALVAWIENRKIRHLPIEERKALDAVASSTWDADCQRYLQSLECPIAWSPDSCEEVLRWLLAFAVALEYRDAAGALNTVVPEAQAEALHASTSHSSHTFIDWGRAEVGEAVARLAQLVQADAGPGALAKQLQAVVQLTGEAVLPAAVSGGVSTDPLAAVQDLPLGFTTGDARVDAAATLLRLQFIRELRALQSQVDGAVVCVQELTANPRTEAALGRVGR